MAGFLSLVANQIVYAQSNLAPSGYPSHQCADKPFPPIRPDNFKSEAELASYNHSVDIYNAQTEQYFECIQRYVDNAANDIELIKKTLASTIEAANN